MTEPLYTYDIPSLQPGDILLSTTSEKASGLIRAATGSPYSHAMLYTYKTIVHADGDGVFSTNPQRRLFLENQSIVLRLRSPHRVDLNAVCAFALDRAGSLYTVPEAMLAAVMGASGASALSPSQFCSRLVAQAFEAGGVSLVRNADFCVPGQFRGSELLRQVPEAVRLATPGEIKLNETRDTVKIHQQHTFAWLGQVRALASARGVEVASISDALHFVLSHPDTDAEAASFITQSGYLDDCELDCEANPYRYSVEGMEAVLARHPNEVRDILGDELRINDEVAQNALVQMQQMYVSSLSTFRLFADMHRRRLKQILERVTVVRIAAKRYGMRDIVIRAEAQQEVLAHCMLLGRREA